MKIAIASFCDSAAIFMIFASQAGLRDVVSKRWFLKNQAPQHSKALHCKNELLLSFKGATLFHARP
ncbi:hypothetical protein [Massilia sp. TWR1-2-2]|uniref:hypothetical protein n=1 Tax=Massilia sp. TWR1-2-2 TaxID=2804584 RepID=UPI003CE84234